jgi:hypothetical protein
MTAATHCADGIRLDAHCRTHFQADHEHHRCRAIMHIDDLTPAQRNLVQALIAAGDDAKRREEAATAGEKPLTDSLTDCP